MPPWAIGALRAGLQLGWTWLAALVAARLGVQLPEHTPALVEALALAAALAAVTGAVQWLERRGDSTLVGRVARLLARVMMLGFRPARYPQARVAGDDLVPRPVAAAMSRRAYGGS